jgi:hypothetical protein
VENDNIIAINIPNIVSILIMAVVGGFLIGLASKALRQARGGSSMSATG